MGWVQGLAPGGVEGQSPRLPFPRKSAVSSLDISPGKRDFPPRRAMVARSIWPAVRRGQAVLSGSEARQTRQHTGATPVHP